MHLKAWREEQGMTRAQVAERIERTPEAVRRYEEGERIPDRATMLNIFAATDELVTPNDFFGVASPALCTVCDVRLDDAGIRSCSVRECPHAQAEAA